MIRIGLNKHETIFNCFSHNKVCDARSLAVTPNGGYPSGYTSSVYSMAGYSGGYSSKDFDPILVSEPRDFPYDEFR